MSPVPFRYDMRASMTRGKRGKIPSAATAGRMLVAAVIIFLCAQSCAGVERNIPDWRRSTEKRDIVSGLIFTKCAKSTFLFFSSLLVGGFITKFLLESPLSPLPVPPLPYPPSESIPFIESGYLPPELYQIYNDPLSGNLETGVFRSGRRTLPNRVRLRRKNDRRPPGGSRLKDVLRAGVAKYLSKESLPHTLRTVAKALKLVKGLVALYQKMSNVTIVEDSGISRTLLGLCFLG